MKKISLVFLSMFLVISLSSSVLADETENTATPTGIRNGQKIRKEFRNEIKNEIKEVRDENKDERKNLLDNLKDKINGIKDSLAKIIGAEVTVNSGTTLTVTKDGKIYTVNTDANTVFKRRYWGNAKLSEMPIGDKVNVWGKFTDTTQTTVDAKMIRDVSIMKRFGVLVGTVKTVTGNTLTIDTVNRGTQSATVSSLTKFVNRKEVLINQSDIVVGHKIRVKGMWNEASSMITEVTHVKDFTLPVKSTSTETKGD